MLLAFTVAADGRRLYALVESDTVGHFALVEIDTATGDGQDAQPGSGVDPGRQSADSWILVSAKGQGFLTSLASARSDIWLLEGFQQPRGWLSRLLRLGR